MKSPQTAVTLKDIAKKSLVSITTVSRILNGRETGIPIREETRQRVLAAAAELGYHPNLMARSLRGSNSMLLGVIFRDISDAFHIQILQGINQVAAQRGYRLFLGHVNYQPDAAVAYGAMLEQSHADGIIIIGDIEGDEAAHEVLLRQHRFVVGVTDRIARRKFPGVYADSVQGTQLALEHLWGLGHRNIVCVTYPNIIDGKLRSDVYEKFMRDHDLADQVRVYLTAQEPQLSYQLGREIFTSPNPPTAIYAASDTIAIGLLQAAFQVGIAIPDQVSIIGFDNIDITEFTIPPLTTVNQSGVAMGQTAANLMIDLIEQERKIDEVNDIVLNPTLVVRQSTAPPPKT